MCDFVLEIIHGADQVGCLARNNFVNPATLTTDPSLHFLMGFFKIAR
jgi:hypothetical protein